MEAIIGLVGVVIGGFLSYFTQATFQEETEKRNDLRNKHIAYNKFLLLDGQKSPVVVNMHRRQKLEFDIGIYKESIRKILFENLHLFDTQIVEHVLELDLAIEEYLEYDDSQDVMNRIYGIYTDIVQLIKIDYEKDRGKTSNA